MSLEDIDGLLGAAHVGAFGDELAADGDQGLGFLARDFVLGGTGESDVDLADVGPGTGTVDVLELLVELVAGGNGGELLALNLEVGDQVDFLGGEAALGLGEDERALAVGEGDDGTAELDDLESFELGDVAGSGECNALTGEGFLAAGDVLDHVLNVLFALVSIDAKKRFQAKKKWRNLRKRHRNRWLRGGSNYRPSYRPFQ